MSLALRVGGLVVGALVLCDAIVGAASPARQPLRLKSGIFDPLTEALPTPDAPGPCPAMPARADAVIHAIVQFHGGASASATAAVAIERAGARVLAYVPDGALLVRATPAALERLRKDTAVRWCGRLEPRDRMEPGLLGSRPEAIVVTLFPDESVIRFRGDMLSGLGSAKIVVEELGTPSPVLGSFVRLDAGAAAGVGSAGFGDDALALIVSDEHVWYVERFHEPRPVNTDTIWVGQSHDIVARSDYSVSATIWNQGLLGTGQVAAVLDTGFEPDACFFKRDIAVDVPPQFVRPPAIGVLDPDAKTRALYVLPGFDPRASTDHGTGTMGILAGDELTTLSSPTSHGNDPGDGMAPNAQLVGQVPLAMGNSLRDAFEQARDSGAHIHSNSWVSGWNFYTEACRQADAFAFEHEDFLAFFGAGNNGGSPDNGLVNAPSVAKNVVSVGGTGPGRLNDAEDLADRSRGPAFDGRIKPDIVAPASGIATAGGDGLPGTNDCSHQGFGGTSAATPAVAGFAVLARQYFSDGFHPSGRRNAGDEVVPSAALLKASLLNGAAPLRGVDSATGLPIDPVPSFNQGWGRVLLDSVLYFQGDSRHARAWDRWNAAGLRQGETDEFVVPGVPGQPLKVTLVWTDAPAAPSSAQALVRDLDLEVVAPSGAVFLGNEFAAGESVPGGVADDVNNVEGVLVGSPEAGSYRIRVTARSIPPAPLTRFPDRQGHAVVATFGPCGSALASPSTLTARGDGASIGVLLAWDAVPGAQAYTIYRGDGGCADVAGKWTFLGETLATSFVDARAEGGVRHAYRVRATDGCGESSPSPCAEAVSAAPCLVAPVFGGIQAAEADGTTCAIRLRWDPASSSCPLGSSVTYAIYRSASPDFIPSAAELVAAGVHGLEHVDSTAPAAATSFYVVRAEDGTLAGGGPHHGGNEDRNLKRANATSQGAPGTRGTWRDDGGDTAARFSLAGEWGVEPRWSVSTLQNHSAGGARAYRSGLPGALYPVGACSAIESPSLSLDASGSSILSYWTRYNLEDHLDGVVVEISDDDGARWLDLPPDAGYPGDFALTDIATGLRVNACFYPPTQGAFSGPTGNAALTPWTQSTTDLSAWAGRTIRIRFRLATEAVLEGADGFFVDDIEVSDVLLPGACAPCTTPGPVGDTLRGSKVPPSDILFTWSDLPDAASYRLVGSADARMRSLDVSVDATGGASGALHAGALDEPGTIYYVVRALDSCGGLAR